MSKRAFDLVVATALLCLLSPLLALIAVLVAVDSRGPVFFRQTRIGRDGRPFEIFKFRTMVDRAYALGPRLTQKRDPRITRIGAVLRWLKLDELPQLLNVVRGDMSLVGPRPEDPYFVSFYTPEQRAVLSVRPGIVGPSQILGRDELEKYPDDVADTARYYIEHILPEKLATDLGYVRSCSLVGDLRLIVAGVAVTVLGAFKRKFFRLKRGAIALLALDTLASVAVYHLAFGLKFEWSYEPAALEYLGTVTLLILFIRAPLFVYFGLYQNILRYLGTKEFLAILKAVTVGSALVTAATFMTGLRSHSRLVLLIDWGLLVPVLFGIRVAAKSRLEARRRQSVPAPGRMLIAGVGDTGPELVAALAGAENTAYRPVGFLDDDPARHGAIIHGLPVLGAISDLPVVTALNPVDLVVVVFPGVSSESLRRVVDHCRRHHVEYRLVPSLDHMLRGGVVIREAPDLGEPETNGAAAPAVAGQVAAAGPDGRSHASNGHPAVRPHGPDDRVVLVTGGAGYIGSHVVRQLLERGRRVRVLDNHLYGDEGLRDVKGHPRLEIIEGDIRHLRAMALAAKGVHTVIALAALVGDAACDLDPDETLSTNVEASRLLAEVCQSAGVHRLVFASSCSVYGANSELILNEGSWLHPVSLYARSRIRSEEELLRRRDRLSVTIVRLATVFGWSARMRLDLVVNTFVAHAYFHGKIRVFGGDQWRPNVHVQDAAEAFILAAEADDATVRGEVFNVGDNGQNFTVRQIAEMVKRELPKTEIESLDASADQRDYRVSFDKIRHVLGFTARFTVRDGIRELHRAFAERRVVAPDDERYHNFRYLKRHGFAGGAHAERLLATGA